MTTQQWDLARTPDRDSAPGGEDGFMGIPATGDPYTRGFSDLADDVLDESGGGDRLAVLEDLTHQIHRAGDARAWSAVTAPATQGGLVLIDDDESLTQSRAQLISEFGAGNGAASVTTIVGSTATVGLRVPEANTITDYRFFDNDAIYDFGYTDRGTDSGWRYYQIHIDNPRTTTVTLQTHATNYEWLGDVPIASLDTTGTPSATTYLRGDGAWETPEGGGGSGGDGQIGLTLIGTSPTLTGSWQNVPATAGGNLTRGDLDDVFYLDLSYSRTNSDLRMSGIVRKADIVGTTSYRFQLQGAGGDYVEIGFNSAQDTGIFRIQEDSNNVTSAVVRVYHLSAAAGPPGSGSTINVEEEGSLLATAADTLNFTGAGVTASGTGGEKTINIPGGSGGLNQTQVDARVNALRPYANAAPGNTAGSASTGSSSRVARQDHDHGITPGAGLNQTQVDARVQAAKGTATPVNTTTAGAGTSTSWAPDDHDHGISAGGKVTFMQPSATQDDTSNGRTAGRVWILDRLTELETAIGNLSSPSNGDIAWGMTANGSATDNVRIYIHQNSRWSLVSTQDVDSWKNDGGVGTGDDDTPVFDPIIPQLTRPSYQGDASLTFTGPATTGNYLQIPDVDEVYHGQTVVIHLDATMPADLEGATDFAVRRVNGSEVSERQNLVPSKHWYVLPLSYTIVPNLELSPLNLTFATTGTGTVTVDILDVYHLDGEIDDASWELYRLALQTMQERVEDIESREWFRGAWDQHAGYLQGQMVAHGASDSRLYVAKNDLPAQAVGRTGPRFDSANWAPVTDYFGAWAAGYNAPGNFVMHNGEFYVTVADVAAGTTEPQDDNRFLNLSYVATWDDLAGNLPVSKLPTFNTYNNGETLRLRFGSGTDIAETTIARANPDENDYRDGVIAGADLRKLRRLLTLTTYSGIASGLNALTGDGRLDYESLQNRPTIPQGGHATTGNHTLTTVAGTSWLLVGTLRRTDIPNNALFAVEVPTGGTSHYPQSLEFQLWDHDTIPEITANADSSSPRGDGWPVIASYWPRNSDRPNDVSFRIGRVGENIYLWETSSSPLLVAGTIMRFDWLR